MQAFPPNRSLLNPKFEGYKFHRPVYQEDTIIRYHLEYKPSQQLVSAKTPLSFHEVQSRITHNHLAVLSGGSCALYVDADYRVVLINVDLDAVIPSFRVIYELPRPVQSTSVESPHREYPSTAFLTRDIAFVSDGQGTLYILHLDEFGPAKLLGLYELQTTSHISSLPFRVHNVMEVSSTRAVAVLSSRDYDTRCTDEPSTYKHHNNKTAHVEFDICAVQFVLPVVSTSSELQKMDVLWRRRGEDVPLYTFYDTSREALLFLGGSPYREIGSHVIPPYEPSPDEMAPFPRLEDGKEKEPEKPPPYSWTQSSDSVTVAFPVPSSTPTSNIKIIFSPRTLTVHVQGDAPSSSVPLPHYSMKELWDAISPSSSMWTLDREGEHSFGLLTIHLDKQHEETKWMHVFAASGVSAASETTNPEDIDVPETLDPSELWHIRESLEKYTAALATGEDASSLSLGRGVPALVEGEMDDEIDSNVGRRAFLTWVNRDGSTPLWPFNDTPFTVLSTPVPGLASSGTTTTLIVKNILDGTVHTLFPHSAITAPPSEEWVHSATFSALAFVLASKQDVRFTFHIPSSAVLAFENGARDGGGNVYIYRDHKPGEKSAQQTVFKVGDASSGSLLGVGALRAEDGKVVILVLSEGELVLINRIL